MLVENKFEILRVDYLLSPNFWLQSVHHWLSEKKHFKKFAKFFDVSFFPLLVLASLLDVTQRFYRTNIKYQGCC